MSDLSLPEMIQILDVAREMRLDRELVSRELSHEETVQRLRERLLASTQITGDQVTPAEVEAAIKLYFENQYTYHEPTWGVGTLLAHLYIRRTLFTVFLVATAVLWAGLSWWPSPNRFSVKVGPQDTAHPPAPVAVPQASPPVVPAAPDRNFEQEQGELEKALSAVSQTTSDPAAIVRLEALKQQMQLAQAVQDFHQLDATETALRLLSQELASSFTVQIVQEGRSAARRDFTDDKGTRVAGYYVIVEAVGPQGPLPMWIESQETGERRQVTTWGEQVPETVYERLKQDKLAEGILNERLLARKSPGRLAWEMTLADSKGQPIPRGGQILAW